MNGLLNTRKEKQQGNILVLFCVGLIAMIGTASMALDGGHLLLNKSRLQLLVDAAALSAATELHKGGDHQSARQAAVDMINQNLTFKEFTEIANEVDLSGANTLIDAVTEKLSVEFSLKPDPFEVTGDVTAQYIRVKLNNLPLNSFLAQVVGLNKTVDATSVAGPSTVLEECYSNLMPLVVCGANDDASDNFGLPINQLQILKTGAGMGPDAPIGPGNFQIIKLDGSNGADDVLKALAGEDYNGEMCFNSSSSSEDGQINTQPGGEVGPVAKGINTRMGEWKGGKVNNIDHPRDLNICQGDYIPLTDDDELDTTSAEYDQAYRYNTYISDTLSAGGTSAICSNIDHTGDIVPPDPARSERRILQVLVGDCDGETNGASQLGYFGSACFFLTQSVIQKGLDAYIVGEYVEACTSEGIPSGTAEDLPGPYKIVLYHAGVTDA